MTKLIKHLLVCLFITQASIAFAQINEYAELNEIETKLAQRVNFHFTSNGLPVLPVSKSLTATARWNSWDLAVNSPINESCDTASWSGAMPNKWTALCFTGDDSDVSSLFNKPAEITGYAGGFSLQIRYSNSTFPSIEALTAELDTMKFWLSDHVNNFKTFGVSSYRNYLVIWFGDRADARGNHNFGTNLSNVTGLWFDPSLSGSGFNLLTVPDGKTTIIYYGNTQRRGERLWLTTDNLTLSVNQTVTTSLYEVTGTDFTAPKRGTKRHWGTLNLTLTSCTTGRAIIDGKNGRLEYNNLQLLAAPDGVNCF